MTKRKSGQFSEEGIESLAKNKPIVYRIEDDSGTNIYTGVAKRGRVEDRLKEHLPGGKDPIPGGAKVKIEQKESIAEAEKSEARIIKSAQPRYNEQGK